MSVNKTESPTAGNISKTVMLFVSDKPRKKDSGYKSLFSLLIINLIVISEIRRIKKKWREKTSATSAYIQKG